MTVLLGLDIGTTSTIGILINSRGETLGVASRRTRTLFRSGQLGRGRASAVVGERG